jgi:D-glycero-alpha-D-manno-heptose-7-phosphate kinase
MTGMAESLRDSLCRNDPDVVGEVLHESWLIKRQIAANISSGRIDEWYQTARRHGAIGGKILGAGGGGFLLLYAHPHRHDQIVSALPELNRVPFAFEPQGSKIIYVEETP